MTGVLINRFCFFFIVSSTANSSRAQQPRLRFGDSRPRPGFVAAQDHGQSDAAVSAGAVRRDAGQQVQHGRPGSGARPVGEQDDCRVSAPHTRTGWLDARVDRYQLQDTRTLAPFGAANRPSEFVFIHRVSIILYIESIKTEFGKKKILSQFL